ncbi:hypothetical protein FOYG_06021 [Fusarium oxysporum NRRL 32931]|uniref:Uncharacterized protein n=1 Tax=Fusarium oxysporum NRRL 32931 TaxID=660029 RepID=W9IC34_FUSOX|nr:hypothetical protein FOYG_06021 [Fusarium oxysporum NRRL 32931]
MLEDMDISGSVHGYEQRSPGINTESYDINLQQHAAKIRKCTQSQEVV